MALSDLCFEFVEEMKSSKSKAKEREIVSKFQIELMDYCLPPYRYGDELQLLVSACNDWLSATSSANTDPTQRLIFLADSIRDWHDTPPGNGARLS